MHLYPGKVIILSALLMVVLPHCLPTSLPHYLSISVMELRIAMMDMMKMPSSALLHGGPQWKKLPLLFTRFS